MVMKQYLLATAFVLLVAVTALGQTSAVIEGPASALPGELVVLNSSKSIGDNHKWITPDGLSTAQAGCNAIDSQVFFATPKAGKYEFILIVTDTKASIEFARHTVEIKIPNAPEPPPPLPPANPGRFEQLKDLSQRNASTLNDAPTRKVLAMAIRQSHTALKTQCEAGTCPTLAGAQAVVQRTIEAALLARTGNSRNVDWLGGWRIPNNQLMSQLAITSVTDYLEAINAICMGLE